MQHTPTLGSVRQKHTLEKRGETDNHDFFMSNSIHDSPGQAGMSNRPPEASPQKDTGEREIDYQPDYSPHSCPVDERNDNNPVPWIVLSGFYNEGEHDSNSKARIT